MKQGSTGLTVRELQVYNKPAVELSQKQISLWLNNLPAANLGESSQNIYRLLIDINQTIIAPQLRLTILNTIEPTALKLIDALETQFINNHISLTDKQRKIAALVQAMQTELSIGYHAVIESIITEGVTRLNKKRLASAISLAIKYHGLVILRCYQLYASVPGRIWRELYRLYQLAQENQVETIESKVSSDEEKRSAKSYFTQIMLLGISSPYQLRQSEIELVWQLLPKYLEFCSLEAHSYSKHPFIINLNSNQPPVQKSLYDKKDNENLLKISLVAVTEKIKIDLSLVSENARYSARKAMVYKHLIHCWSQGTQRSFARTPCLDKIQISIGLGATHFLLTESILERQSLIENDEDDELIEIEAGSQTLDAMEGSLRDVTLSSISARKHQKVRPLDRNYLSTSAITDNDVWAKLYRPDQAISEDEKNKLIATRSRDTIVRETYKIQNSELINMSPGGYCIQVPSDELPKHSQTGEIIGFIEGEDLEQHWSVGVVRWVRRQLKGNYIQMGVQLLAPDIVPINIQRRNSKNKDNTVQRALLLPALTGVGQAATIITNPLAFSINNKLRVMELSKEYDVRLNKEIGSSSSSRQFGFEIITNTEDAKNNTNNEKLSDPGNIDGVWDLI